MKLIGILVLCVFLIGCAVPEAEEEAETEVIEEEPIIEEPEPEPIILLEKGFLFEHEGREIILADVNPQVTYCRIRVDNEALMISIGNERSVHGLTIKVLSASIDPKRVCEVEIK